jgi:HD-like signal output (HDOD) protein
LPLYPYSQTPSPQEKTVLQPSDYREKLLSSVETLPPLPTVLNQLLKLMNDANSSAGQISALIETDGVLSGNVLRCVNSAYYGLQSRVSSIRHAVTLLGFETLRNLALAFSMRRMLVKPKASSRKLSAQYSQHALGCAMMTQFLAHYAKSEDVDAAFAAGLFHDVGKLLIINTLPEMFPPLIEHWETSGADFEVSEQALLGVSHSQLSSVVLEKWKLSDVIQAAAAYHHDPGACPSVGDQDMTLAHLVHAADLYVRFYGLEIVSSAKRPPSQPDQAFERIGLIDGLPELVERFQAEFKSIQGVFQ